MLSSGFGGLTVEIEDLMTNILEVGHVQIDHVTFPPMLLVVVSIEPVLDLEFGELGSQVHDGDGDDLGFPLETECGTQ